MEFVDRNREQVLLKRALNGEKRSFVVVYGRRRLGKSTLIRRMLGDGDVYYEASLADRAMQISMLARAVGMVYERFERVVYRDWEDVIMAFNDRCAEGSTLVLDEFPYMVQRDASLPSVLQRILDRRVEGGEGLRCNIVVCGSSQRMMMRLLDGAEPLYGRAEYVLGLKPVSMPYWLDLTDGDARRLVEEYSVWGGVPRYWGLREEYGSMEEAIRGLVLSDLGTLWGEPGRLFMDDVQDVAPYLSIMTALGSGHLRYMTIADAVGRKTAELGKPMNHLMEMAYVRREVPWGEDEQKSKKTLYRIDDPFMAFYYRFVEPNRSMLAMGRDDVVWQWIERDMPMHVGEVWERLCQCAVSGRELGGHVWSIAQRWWGKAPVYAEGRKTPIGYEDLEFDVVAEDVADHSCLLVGECKWTAADYADRLLAKLKHKVALAPFAQNKRIVYVLMLRERPLSCPDDCLVLLPEDVMSMLY